MKKHNSLLMPVIIVLMFIIGASIFLYPTVSNFLSEKNSSKKTEDYTNTVSQFDQDYLKAEKQKAIEYNEALNGDPVRDPFLEGSGMALPDNYLDVLNINGTMCTIIIPKINVNLPVYHGTSESVLKQGVGHIRQTAVPIGGIGNNSILTGHTGLTNAKLFTDLDKLELGDIFIIYVLDETHVYEIEDISVILPDEISSLEPIPGKDCVTLVTCTPYGVNSHRLIVRGVRVADESADSIIEAYDNTNQSLLDILYKYKEIIIVAVFLIAFIVIAVIIAVKTNKNKKKQEEQG